MIYVIVHAQLHLDESSQTSYISYLMNQVQIQAKQSFNKFLDEALLEMKESHVKSGVLPHMRKLPVCIFII